MKKVYCKKCIWYCNAFDECLHKSNIVTESTYKEEKHFFHHRPYVLNGDNDCSNYEDSYFAYWWRSLFKR
jgi:hypothetical protein